MALSLPLHVFNFFVDLGVVKPQMATRLIQGAFALLSPQTTVKFESGIRVAQALNAVFLRRRMDSRVDISTLGKAPTRAVRRANWLALIVPLSRIGVAMEVEDVDLISDGDTTVLTDILMQIYRSQKSWLAKVNRELALEKKGERGASRLPQTQGYCARLAVFARRRAPKNRGASI